MAKTKQQTAAAEPPAGTFTEAQAAESTEPPFVLPVPVKVDDYAEIQAILTDMSNRLISERGNVYRLRELLFGDGFQVG